MPVRTDIHLPVEDGRHCLTVAGIDQQTRPWFGFEDEIASMKQEPEVIVLTRSER